MGPKADPTVGKCGSSSQAITQGLVDGGTKRVTESESESIDKSESAQVCRPASMARYKLAVRYK